MRPIQVNSFSEYIEVFGDTVLVAEMAVMLWRDGETILLPCMLLMQHRLG
jgi:hypothetical protein